MSETNAVQSSDWLASRTPIWSDDFDMDLVALYPDIVTQPEIIAAEKTPLWVHASTGVKDGKTMMSHPSSWNGPGALYFSRNRPFKSDADGWTRLPGGFVTREPWLCVSVWDAIRDTWAHHLDVSIDFRPWTSPPVYEDYFYPIMSHIRGWSTLPDIEDFHKTARQWAARACTKALRLIAAANNQEEERQNGR